MKLLTGYIIGPGKDCGIKNDDAFVFARKHIESNFPVRVALYEPPSHASFMDHLVAIGRADLAFVMPGWMFDRTACLKIALARECGVSLISLITFDNVIGGGNSGRVAYVEVLSEDLQECMDKRNKLWQEQMELVEKWPTKEELYYLQDYPSLVPSMPKSGNSLIAETNFAR